MTVAGESYDLGRREADQLREALGRALTERREYLSTVGEYRDDGSYVVSRRGADSSGHRKVFESFETLTELYDRLPETFAAEEVGERGLTGGRRHILVHHFAEHPDFDCGLVSRQPLTARKEGTSEDRGDSQERVTG